MKGIDQLRRAMSGLHKQEAELKKTAREYQALQRLIDQLRARSAFDAQARRKLEKLDAYMSSQGRDAELQIAQRVQKFAAVQKQLGEELTRLSSGGEGSKSSPESARRKKHGRAFV